MVASSAANPADPRGRAVAREHVSWATTAMPCASRAVTCPRRRVRSPSASGEVARRRPKRGSWTSRTTSSSNRSKRNSIPSSRGPGSPQVKRRAVRARALAIGRTRAAASTCGPVLVSGTGRCVLSWGPPRFLPSRDLMPRSGSPVAMFSPRPSRCSMRSTACEVALSTVGALPSTQRLGPSRSGTRIRHCSSRGRSGVELGNAVTSANRIRGEWQPSAR